MKLEKIGLRVSECAFITLGRKERSNAESMNVLGKNLVQLIYEFSQILCRAQKNLKLPILAQALNTVCKG